MQDDGKYQFEARREFYRLYRGLADLSEYQLKHVFVKERFVIHIPHMWALLWVAVLTLLLSSSCQRGEEMAPGWWLLAGVMIALLIVAYLFRNGNGKH